VQAVAAEAQAEAPLFLAPADFLQQSHQLAAVVGVDLIKTEQQAGLAAAVE
jgi:hypothetical protein